MKIQNEPKVAVGESAGRGPFRPLDLKAKFMTLLDNLLSPNNLNPCEIRVLAVLLQRQNTSTGRCDPSVLCLMNDTGYSERSVRGALSKLVERGVIRRRPGARSGCNQFTIRPVTEAEIEARWRGRVRLKTASSSRQIPSTKPAENCMVDLQEPAPKKKNENIKNSDVVSRNDHASRCSSHTLKMSEEEFEKRIAKIFEKKGYGYEGLVGLKSGFVAEVFDRYVANELDFSNAVSLLLEEYQRSSQ